MSCRKLLVYLADLDYFTAGNRISVPLNIGLIKSYCKTILGEAAELKLFKHPEKLMREVKKNKPDVLGLSFYMWNANLGLKVVKCCKKISPKTITVIGGSSAARTPKKYKKLFKQNPCLDIITLDQGEKSFANILKRAVSKKAGKSMLAEAIPGCATKLKNKIKRGPIEANSKGFLNKIPSPYLKGYLDQFLKEGLLPLVETSRGCPYNCTYCGQGNHFFSTLDIKDEKIVYKELLYLQKHSKSRELCITDSNFGIMGKRDKRISAFMLKLYRKHNFPFVTDVASAKVKTSESIESMKNLAKITCSFYFGLQTLSKKVLEKSCRKNIPMETIQELSQAAKKDGVSLTVDLIFGLPGETVESFMETVSKVVALGIDNLSMYNLRMLPGTAIAEKERKKYGYKTRFRPFNNRYDEYELISGEKRVRVIETEEIAYQSSTFDRNDYIYVRKYGFLVELLVSYGAFTETFLYLASKNVDSTKVIGAILQQSGKYKRLERLFKEYEEHSEGELFKSEQELINKICKDDKQWHDLLACRGKYFKINLGFAGYSLLENTCILEDIENIIWEYAKRKLGPGELEDLSQVLKYDKMHRLITGAKESRLTAEEIKREIRAEEKYDYRKWALGQYKGRLISDCKYAKPIKQTYHIRKYGELVKAVKDLETFSCFNFYERILMQVPRCSLKREHSKGGD